ncbi:MAG: phenylacetate-CoA oxygenase subunit PaaI [Chitinophagia bacterium]|nr:phenylacetate-CoA oxygenase subunit PaaI [Chitinophagia bacterium]
MLLSLVLRLADDALIHGHRLSEWCGHGPILEQDIALTNTSLDHLGRARSLYQYAATLFNSYTDSDKNATFTSIALKQAIASGTAIHEDHLAYLRDAWDFRNVLLVEQPNTDWAYTVVKCFMIDTFNVAYFTALQHCTDSTLAAIAAKSLKEATYHRKWSSEWVIRLGDGTEESHARIKNALHHLWMYLGEMYKPTDYELSATDAIQAPNVAALLPQCLDYTHAILAEATLDAPPANAWMQSGGKTGIHSEHLGYILAEMQYMQRTYPGMEW